MTDQEDNQSIIDFFEKIEKYYGSKTEITEGICTSNGDFNANYTTWNLFEFDLIRSAYRNNGARFMMEGNGMYYEIDAQSIIALNQPGRNKFEFVERLADNVFRITKLRFHYKY
ncbi:MULTISPECIES: hypothetical protein [Flavobacterium]|uniref:Uncharacterized protein n=1 Tax=Flavobacterium hankyongi TaxID=1176532 RepID=A0ABP9A793_9FLAO|nr:hypothetical protein [Flavobacterium sp. N1846]